MAPLHHHFEKKNWQTIILPNEQFLPAGGQGVIALQVRQDDEAARETLAPLNHAPTFLCLRAEREFLRLLHGDCGTPVGVLEEIEGDWLNLRAQIFPDEGGAPKNAQTRVRITSAPEALADDLFRRMFGA